MDEWLANVYGTNAAGSENDLEKTAQAMMLEKLAESEGIDLSGLNEEQLDSLAQQVVSDNEAQPGTAAPEAQVPAGEEEAQAKFAEADFLGRVMAHSYTQELSKIASEGGPPPFPPAAAEEKKCDKCDKAKCECPPAEKTAQGPLTQAIAALGGTVVPPEEQQAAQADPAAGGEIPQNAAQYVEKLAESRAQEMAIQFLHENGYIK